MWKCFMHDFITTAETLMRNKQGLTGLCWIGFPPQESNEEKADQSVAFFIVINSDCLCGLHLHWKKSHVNRTPDNTGLPLGLLINQHWLGPLLVHKGDWFQWQVHRFWMTADFLSLVAFLQNRWCGSGGRGWRHGSVTQEMVTRKLSVKLPIRSGERAAHSWCYRS